MYIFIFSFVFRFKCWCKLYAFLYTIEKPKGVQIKRYGDFMNKKNCRFSVIQFNNWNALKFNKTKMVFHSMFMANLRRQNKNFIADRWHEHIICQYCINADKFFVWFIRILLQNRLLMVLIDGCTRMKLNSKYNIHRISTPKTK